MPSAAYLEKLADFACDFRAADMPPLVLERCKWILADCIGVIGAGMQEPEMRAFIPLHLLSAAAGKAWVIGARTKTNALSAAFLNGTAGTWLELDEGNTLSKGHPGIQIVPAALGYAQEHPVSGLELIGALAVGYEVSSRINLAGNIRPAIHPHGTFGVIGAALAVARLKGLARRDYVRLMNIAAALPVAASYRTLDEGATVRNVFTGHSAFMGMTAVGLIEAGFTGESDGVRRTYGELLGDGFDAALAVAGLGEDWMSAGGYFKLYPTARSIHPAIEAVEQALACAPGAALAAEDVAGIRVRTYGLAARKAQTTVTTAFGAKFSIPFALATFIVHGRATLDCFGEQAVSNPAVQKLTRLVQVEEDARMTSVYPGRQPCEVVITLKNGTRYTGLCDIVSGEPGRPNTISQVQEKFMQLSAAMWCPTAAKKLFEDCMRMESISDVSSWSETCDL